MKKRRTIRIASPTEQSGKNMFKRRLESKAYPIGVFAFARLNVLRYGDFFHGTL